MIDWDKFDNAVEASILYRDSLGVTVAQRLVKRPTQTKTVADAVEQEGEKWTHIDAFGDPCRILIEEKDVLGYVVILRQNGHYATPGASSLKPIKPTISEDQARAVMEFATEHGLISEGQIWTSMERDII